MRRIGLARGGLALALPAAAAAKEIELHAHRGGTLADGHPVTPLRGYDALGPQWPSLTPTYVTTAQAAGFEAIPYTLNSVEAMEAADAAGVDGVITDDPDRALKVLRRTP